MISTITNVDTVSAGTFANPSAPGGELFPFFGAITYYDFNTTISTTTTSLRVQNVYTQPVNTKLFVVPSLTYTQTYQPGSGSKVLVRAAVSSHSEATKERCRKTSGESCLRHADFSS